MFQYFTDFSVKHIVEYIFFWQDWLDTGRTFVKWCGNCTGFEIKCWNPCKLNFLAFPIVRVKPGNSSSQVNGTLCDLRSSLTWLLVYYFFLSYSHLNMLLQQLRHKCLKADLAQLLHKTDKVQPKVMVRLYWFHFCISLQMPTAEYTILGA